MKRFGFAGLVLSPLLFAAQVVSAQEARPEGCPWGYSFDPMNHGYVVECFNRPASTLDAAAKPAGLAAPVPAVNPEQALPGCPWGYSFDPMNHGYVVECFSRPASTLDAAAKPAGLAAPAPAVNPEQALPCLSWGEAYDPMTHVTHGYVPEWECLSRTAA